MNRARADNVTQFAGIERCDQFALTAESRKELVGETDHLSGFHVTGEWKRKIQQLIKYLINPIVSLVWFQSEFDSIHSPVFHSLSANKTGSFEREFALCQSHWNGVHETERREAILTDLRIAADLHTSIDEYYIIK